MAQASSRYCPRCGTRQATSRPFCTNCGLRFNSPSWAGVEQPQQPQPGNPDLYNDWEFDQQPVQEVSEGPTQRVPVSHPGFDDPGRGGRARRPNSQPGFEDLDIAGQSTQRVPTSHPGFSRPPEWPSNPGLSPNRRARAGAPAFPQSSLSGSAPKKRSRTGGYLFVLTLLFILILVVIGAANYFGAIELGFGPQKPVAQAPINSTPVNKTLKYANVQLTIQSIQRANNFLDDPYTVQNGMLRVNIQEQNSLKETVQWRYIDIARLVQPDGKVLTPVYDKAKVGIAAGAIQTSFVDFAVAPTVKTDQLALRIGGDNEAQIDFPLNGNADLAKYDPKQVKINQQLGYMAGDLVYKLQDATFSYAIDGKQAAKGKQYVTLNLAVDNTATQTIIPGAAIDYIQVQAGGETEKVLESTLPISFDVGAVGKKGEVVFEVPQESKNFTFVLAGRPDEGFKENKLPFQGP